MSGLVAEGLVYTRPAQGTYVVDNPDAAISRQNANAAPFSERTLNVGVVSKMLVTHNIGFYHSDMIAGIHKGLIESKANMTILPFDGSESEASLFSHVGRSRLDAAIYVGPFEQSGLKNMIRNGPPAVLLDFPLRNSGTDCIIMDNVGGAQAAIGHLAGLGHAKIAIVSGAKDQPASLERLDGALRAAASHGIGKSDIIIEKGGFTLKGGHDAALRVLKSGRKPTAIFFMNDEMAHGGIKALRENSLRIPEDISVVGFDNSAHALMSSPQLTTVAAPAMQMGKFAVQRLFSKLRNDGEYSPSFTQMDTSLVIRKSTAAPATGKRRMT
jgi:LacI family transcriptional regulator